MSFRRPIYAPVGASPIGGRILKNFINEKIYRFLLPFSYQEKGLGDEFKNIAWCNKLTPWPPSPGKRGGT